jgi:hypothetical protein
MGKSNEIDEIVVRFVFGFYFENISFFTLETYMTNFFPRFFSVCAGWAQIHFWVLRPNHSQNIFSYTVEI